MFVSSCSQISAYRRQPPYVTFLVFLKSPSLHYLNGSFGVGSPRHTNCMKASPASTFGSGLHSLPLFSPTLPSSSGVRVCSRSTHPDGGDSPFIVRVTLRRDIRRTTLRRETRIKADLRSPCWRMSLSYTSVPLFTNNTDKLSVF